MFSFFPIKKCVRITHDMRFVLFRNAHYTRDHISFHIFPLKNTHYIQSTFFYFSQSKTGYSFNTSSQRIALYTIHNFFPFFPIKKRVRLSTNATFHLYTGRNFLLCFPNQKNCAYYTRYTIFWFFLIKQKDEHYTRDAIFFIFPNQKRNELYVYEHICH